MGDVWVPEKRLAPCSYPRVKREQRDTRFLALRPAHPFRELPPDSPPLRGRGIEVEQQRGERGLTFGGVKGKAELVAPAGVGCAVLDAWRRVTELNPFPRPRE